MRPPHGLGWPEADEVHKIEPTFACLLGRRGRTSGHRIPQWTFLTTSATRTSRSSPLTFAAKSGTALPPF